MSSNTFQLPYQTVLDGNGNPVSGAQAFFYQAGTTTLQNTFVDSDLQTAHANPVVADAFGRLPPIYLNDSLEYRVIVRNADGQLIYDEDDFSDQLTPDEVGRALYPQSDNEIGITITSFLYPEGDMRRYGLSTSGSATSNSSVIASAAGLGIDLYFPPGDYSVSSFPTPTAGTVWSGDGRLVTASSHRRMWEYGEVRSSNGSQTFYVSPTGNDANVGTQASPFRTLNRALQQLPQIISFGDELVIQLTDGTHTESDIAAADMSRPALGYVTELYPGDRSRAVSGSDITGSLTIRGTSQAGTILQLSSDITYGIYVVQTANVAVENLTIQSDGTNAANALVTSNRNSYIQMSDVTLDGDNQAQQCLVAEAGGVIELIGASSCVDAVTNAIAFEESLIVVANTSVIGAASSSAIGGRGTIKVVNTASITGNISTEGTELITAGTDNDNRVTVTGTITGFNMDIFSLWTDFSGSLLDLSNTDTQFNVCDWSGQIIIRSGAIRLRGASNSYISPASASTVAQPLVLLGGADSYIESTGDINGSGSVNNVTRGVLVQSITADTSVINFQGQTGRFMQTDLSADGAYTGCTIATQSSDFSQPANEGDRLTLTYDGGNSIEIVNSTTAEIVGGSLTLGQGTGQYQAIELVYRADRLWHEVGRSLVAA